MNDARQKGKGLDCDRQRAVVSLRRDHPDAADVVRPAGHHLTVQPWQTASLPQLLEMMDQMKTAPVLPDNARW